MLIDKLDIVEKRYKEIYQLIGDPEIISNQKKYIELNKELKDLKKLVDKGNDYKTAIASKKEAESYISDSSDKDMTDMAKEQLEESKQNITKLEEEIKILLIPKDPDDSKNVVIEELGFVNGDGSINKLSDGKISTVIPEKLFLKAILGLAISIIVGMVIIGGIKRIGKVASRLVPVMSSIYVAGALFIILWNYDRIADSFYLIFKHAFTPTAATGGFAGATVLYAITWGVRRAAFSNEAGLGSAPIAHADATDPKVQIGRASCRERV